MKRKLSLYAGDVNKELTSLARKSTNKADLPYLIISLLSRKNTLVAVSLQRVYYEGVQPLKGMSRIVPEIFSIHSIQLLV